MSKLGYYQVCLVYEIYTISVVIGNRFHILRFWNLTTLFLLMNNLEEKVLS